MKNRHLGVVLFLFLFAAGCAAHYKVPMMDSAAPPSDVLPKLPLNAVILISDPMASAAYTVKDEADLLGTAYTFPLGRIIEKYAYDLLSPAFRQAVVAKGQPYPLDTDVLVVPKIESFRLRLSPAGFSREAYAKISILFGVYDTNGRLLWEESIHPAEVPGNRPFIGEPGLLEATGSVAAKSVALALQNAAKSMTASREIHAFAAAKGNSQAVAQQTPPKQTPLVTSDVDAPPDFSRKPNRNAYAVVVGIEDYRQKLPGADFAAQDAIKVGEYLTKALGYPAENVVMLLNDHATYVDLVKYFEKWLLNNVEAGGRVFVYYSGHGAPDPKTGLAYLVPYDGDPSFINETGYSLKRMYAALGKLPAEEVIVALDACFSGSGGRSVLAKGARPLVMNLQDSERVSPNMSVLAASSGNQISATYDEKGHGLFTYFMLKGIKYEDVVEPDGSIRLEDLFGYIKPQVERIARKQYNNEQSPQLMEGK